MHPRLEGQVAIVTGGESGIGKAIALKFASQGATVIILGINDNLGQSVVKEAIGQPITFKLVDVSDSAAVDAAVKEIVDSYGKIDILVNNAGITRDGLLMRMSQKDWDDVINVNLKSCFHTCQSVIRPMVKARQGSIINMASIVGLAGNAGQTNYAVSKAGMIGFSKALAREVASRGVRVNCLAPGFIKSPMTEKLSDKQKESLLSLIPLGQMGSPEDVAEAALFLASNASRYITGQVLPVDGGYVM